MQILKGTHIDFVGKRKIAFVISAGLIIIGLISLIAHKGPVFSIDFAGGTLLQIKFERDLSVQEIRSSLEKIGWGDSEIQKFGEGNEVLIRVKKQEVGTMVSDQIKDALARDFPDNKFEVRREEKVGPKIGRELKRKAIWAIIYAMIGILIYISWRFEFKFAVGAIVALFHDVLITLGIFSLLNKEISLAIVAALLTIVGYSLNDTIVVYDRIREDLGIMRTIPGMTVIMPADYHATKALVRAAAAHPGPVYLRFTRDPVPIIYGPDEVFEIGKGKVVREGVDVSLIALGDMLSVALEAADELAIVFT